ncbi:hypothetical protein [Halorubellus litoreus]|uniref:Uncharacterized protein n=1 Tax=Halorubellus litoreus TaxID=755308 RepID=A0ABD5VPE0_9EURY
MTSLSRNDQDAQIPNVSRRFGESATNHVVRMLDEGLPDDDPSILTVGFRQTDSAMGSLETVTALIGSLRERGIKVTGYDTNTATETLGNTDAAPTKCYDAIIVFSPLDAAEDVSVTDLVSEDGTEQYVVDLTGTVEPEAVANDDAVYITDQVL